MPKAQTALAQPEEPKTHRSVRPSRKKSVTVSEFDPAEHRDEIAQLAYLNWLERVGSPEQDWIKAEMEVRAKYTR